MKVAAALMILGLLAVSIGTTFMLSTSDQTSAVVTHHLRTSRQQQQRLLAETTSTHVVSIVLALHFVTETTAEMLETLDPTNEAVDALCSVIHDQASGSQVRNSAADVNLIIETNATDNECTLLATNRDYDTGAEILGPNYLSIEILLQQVVYVTSPDDVEPTTDDEVYDLVENGFNRGRGGRVRTRNLLLTFPPFDDLLDVEVLEELATPTPSQAPSTLAPSTAPTLSPSAVPTTTAPSSAPTEAPTTSPTVPVPTTKAPSISPSVLLSLVPSELPSRMPTPSPTIPPTSASPTLVPSTLPSSVPSVSPSRIVDSSLSGPTAQPSMESDDIPSAQPTSEEVIVPASSSDGIGPGVVAAIVGGTAVAVMACCFSLYLCASNRDRQKSMDEEDVRTPINPQTATYETSTSGRKRPPSSKSSSQGQSVLPFVPEVVQLDDDNRSLANTTLGEHTAGRKPPKKKRLVDMDATMGSFEEESLYTMGITRRIQPSTLIDDDEQSVSRIQPPPKLNGISMDYDNDVFYPDGGDSSEGDSPFKVPPSPMAPKIASLVEEALGAESNDASRLNGNKYSPEDHGSCPSCDGVSRASTKSSGKSARLDVWPSQHLSPTSSRTPESENVVALIALPPSKDENKDFSETIRQRDDSIERREGPDASAMQLLEDEHARSRVSPIDLHGTEEADESPAKLLADEESKARVSPIELRDLDSTEPRERAVISVLSTPVRSPRDLLTRKSYPWDPKPSYALTPRSKSHGQRHRSISPFRTGFLHGESVSSPRSHHSGPAIFSADPASPNQDGDVGKSSKSFFTPDSMDPTMEFQMKKPSDLGESLKKLEGCKPAPTFPSFGDSSVGSSSSSGISNGVDNKWLFGTVADTLGPRSTSADMDSLGGLSHMSAKSNRSYRSARSGRSRGSRGRRRPRKRRTGGSVSSNGSHSSFGSYIDQKSASEISLAPRSLENDLQRLEMQLASLKTPESESRGPSSFGGSHSVSGLSRSSRSTHGKVSSKQRVIVVVPPGKLGVILANRHDGKGTVVSELRPHSVLHGALVPSDRLIEIDGEDVTEMNVSKITSVMASKTEQTRRLTVITSAKIRAHTHDSPRTDLVSTSASGSE